MLRTRCATFSARRDPYISSGDVTRSYFSILDVFM
jgi:hypothetical protein